MGGILRRFHLRARYLSCSMQFRVPRRRRKSRFFVTSRLTISFSREWDCCRSSAHTASSTAIRRSCTDRHESAIALSLLNTTTRSICLTVFMKHSFEEENIRTLVSAAARKDGMEPSVHYAPAQGPARAAWYPGTRREAAGSQGPGCLSTGRLRYPVRPEQTEGAHSQPPQRTQCRL